MLVIPAPSYALAQAGWIPRLTIWRDDGTTYRREGEPCECWAAAMAASWRLTSANMVVGPYYPSTWASATSVWGSQNVIDISRYIFIAVDSSARACSRWPVVAYNVPKLRWQWA